MSLSNRSAGLKANGEVWCWGRATVGQLGDNTQINKSSPVSVVGAHSFVAISAGGLHSAGLKANGEVWCWGSSTTYGQLGDNTATNKSSPVSVVGAHSFVAISLGLFHSAGLKANGEVWCWGDAGYGQLGDNALTDKSSPVLVVGPA